MPQIRLKDNEAFEYALRRFRRTCEKAGVINEARARAFYEKPTTTRKLNKAAAVKRVQKKVAKERNRRIKLY
jgi:small subunit ribosomal protein S21